jgi:type I restriction enzyme S subunit
MSDASMPFAHPWPEGLVGDLGKVTVGGTPSTAVPRYWDGGEVPWMASGDVHLKRITDVPGRITELGLRRSNATLVDPPAVAVGLAGQGKTRGTVALVLCRLSTNQSVALITTNPEKLDAEYLFFNLEFRYDELRSRSAGGGRAGLTKQLIEQVPVPLPQLAEQEKIAEILCTVDRAIMQTELRMAKDKRLKSGLMHDLLTRGIDHHGRLRSEGTHEFQDSPIGRIPRDWDFGELGSISELVTSGSRGWAKYYSKDGALFLRIGNLTRDHINLRFDDLAFVKPPVLSEGKRTCAKCDDILISITADLGIVGVIPSDFGEAYVNQHISLVRLFPDSHNARFVGWFLSGHGGQAQFDRLNESGAKAGLNLPTIRNLVVPLPKRPEEQALIARILDSSTNDFAELNRQREKLRLLKIALMQDLLTGRRRVTVLLEPSVHLTAETV